MTGNSLTIYLRKRTNRTEQGKGGQISLVYRKI